MKYLNKMTVGEINVTKITKKLLRSSSIMSQDILEIYRPRIIREKDKLFELARGKIEQISKTEIARKFRVARAYYTVEMSPPKINEIEKIKADLELTKNFIQKRCWNDLTVKQAWLLLLVLIEVSLWFYVGETIGKMHIVGYAV